MKLVDNVNIEQGRMRWIVFLAKRQHLLYRMLILAFVQETPSIIRGLLQVRWSPWSSIRNTFGPQDEFHVETSAGVNIGRNPLHSIHIMQASSLDSKRIVV